MPIERPNIVLIMADQMTPLLMGTYGHPVVRTPNIDRMARSGIRFDAAYSPCPVCVPARAAMMTGRYVSRIGAYDNGSAFSCEEPTFAHCLTLAGYDTVLSGKMHFIGPDQLHGFRRRFTTNICAADFGLASPRGVDRQISKGHAFNYCAEGIHVGRWSHYLSYDEEAQFRALEYLHARGLERRRRGDAAQPFLLCVSYHHPHEPFWPPRDLWDLYAEERIDVPTFPEDLERTYSELDRWLNVYHGVSKVPNLRDPESMRALRRAYYALVTYVDVKVGRILESLAENDLAGETVVVFTSDHGDMLCEKGMVQKRTFYEQSSRVPLVLSFPDGRGRGTVRTEPVNLIDLAPTLCDVAGVRPEDRPPLDGTSLVSLSDGSDSAERVTFSEYHSQGAHAPCFMVRKGNHKYVYVHGYGSQLFDLDRDPGEWHNLAGETEYAELAGQLKALILERFDPDAIDKAIPESIEKRALVQRAMKSTGTRWDVEPRFDPCKALMDQYLQHPGTSEAPR